MDPMDEDRGLIERCGAGEREAFDELVRKHQRPLYRMLRRMVGNHEDAADLLQGAFVKAFTGLGGFRGMCSFRTWLYRIALNLVKNHYRDRAREATVELDELIAGENPGTLAALIKKQQRLMLGRGLQELPEKQRLTLVLRAQEGHAFAEIAEILKCSPGAARANYHHAVEKLKRLMGSCEAPGEMRPSAEEGA